MDKPKQCIRCKKLACSEWVETKRKDRVFEWRAVPCEYREELLKHLNIKDDIWTMKIKEDNP